MTVDDQTFGAAVGFAAPADASTPAEGGIAPPGIGWLAGWFALSWLGLIIAVVLGALLHGVALPERDPDSSMWFRSWVSEFLRWAVVRSGAGGIEGFVIGTVAFAFLRRRVQRARWLPALAAIGLAAGAAAGLVVGLIVAFQDRDGLYLTDTHWFLVSQSVIAAALSGVGLVVGMAWVLQRRFTHFGLWAAAWVLAFVAKGLTVPLVVAWTGDVSEPNYALIGAAGLLVASPTFALGSGVATWLALRSTVRE